MRRRWVLYYCTANVEFEVAAVKHGRATVCALGLQTLFHLAGKPDTPAMRPAGRGVQGG